MMTRYLAAFLVLAIGTAVAAASYDEGTRQGTLVDEATFARLLGRDREASGGTRVHPLAARETDTGADTEADQKVSSMPTAEEEPAATEGDRPPRRSAVDGAELLRQASRQLGETTYKTTYDLNGTDPGLGALTGTLTIASDGPKGYLGVTGKLGGADGSFIAIHDGTANFLCIEGGGDSACLKTDAHEASPLALPSVLELEQLLDRLAHQPDVDVREIGGERIAGRDGRCFEVGAQPGNGRVCVGESDNLLLLVDGYFHGADFEVRLKEFDPAPGPGDFEPPFPVTEIP